MDFGTRHRPYSGTNLVLTLCIFGAALFFSCTSIAILAYIKGHGDGMHDAAGTALCAPKIIYRRGLDTLSPTELRRVANARERMEKVK